MSCEFDVYPFNMRGGVHREGDRRGMRPFGEGVPVDADADGKMLAEAAAGQAENEYSTGLMPFRDSLSPTLGVKWLIQSSPSTYLDQLKASGIGFYAAANWDEGGTKFGAPFTFKNLQPNSKLIIGPATHCDWTTVKNLTGFDLIIEERRFFDYWLKGVENGVMDEPPVYYYTYNAPEGEEWTAAKTWPPASQATAYFLRNGGTLGTSKPDAAGADRIKVGDDARLVYETEALGDDLTITGHPVVHLWVSATATDVDVYANLEDIAPDGTVTSYHMDGRLRASHRNEHEPPYDNLGLPWRTHLEKDTVSLSPGEPAELVFDLFPISYRFKPGNRIRLTLTFGDPLKAAPDVSIHRGDDHPSYVTLPVNGK
jgi:predicted acyl esterase